jgi:hypothetical protein
MKKILMGLGIVFGSLLVLGIIGFWNPKLLWQWVRQGKKDLRGPKDSYHC